MKQIFHSYVLERPELHNRISRVQLFRFVITGGSSVVIEMVILLTSVEYLGIHYLISNIFAFLITNAYNYLLSRFWVFGEGKHHVSREATFFFLVVLVGLGINQLVLYLMIDYLMVTLFFGKIIAIGITLVWNFASKKYLVFKK